MKKARKLSALLLALVLFLAVGCQNTPTTNGSENSTGDTAVNQPITAVEDTLIVGINGEPSHLNGTQQGEAPNGKVNSQIYDKLVVMDTETGEIVPALADSWEMTDDTTWTFHIREGVTFHNGEPLTAEDILFSYQLNADTGGYQWMWGAIDVANSSAPDDQTLIIKTYDVYPGLLAMLTSEARIVCKSLYEEIGREKYGRQPVGTGPYKFVEWVAGDSITLERYDDYWGNEAYFEKIIFRFITDDNTRALALETGEIDIAQSIPASQVSYLESTGLVDLEIYPSLSIDYIGFNCQKEPFNDVRIRQALRYAIDLESMVDIAYGVGVTAEAADGICTPSFCDYIPASEELTYHYDPEKAKELLAEAGYPDGFSCQVMVVGQQDRVDMVEMLQNAWAEIGVNIEPYVTEIGTYYDIIASGDYDMFYGGWVILANDGDLMHDTFYSDPELWYTTNYTAYVNPEFDELVDAARVELDTEKRSALYGDVQNLIRSELPFIACTYNNKVDGIRSTLQGYPHDPSGYPCLSGVAPKA